VGVDYTLTKSLTALAQDSGQPVLCKLPARAVVTIAAVVRGSCFVHVICNGKFYDLFVDDLEQWSAHPHSLAA
jgi:hypothetical protein